MTSWLARVLVVPTVAVALLWWWGVGELARPGQHVSAWAALLLFGGLGCAVAVPRLAVVPLYGAFLLQLVRPDFRLDQEGWIAYAAIPLAAIVLSARVTDGRRTALATVLPLGILVGLFTNLPALGPRILTEQGVEQVGQVNGALVGGPYASPPLAIAVGALVWSAGAMALIVAGWLIGSSYRSRRLQWAAESAAAEARADLIDSRVELRLTEERDRIAQDVHDLTAHSLSVILAQADGAAALVADGDGRAALTTIASRARSALVEVRGILEQIDRPARGDSAHSADEIDALVAAVRATGRDAELDVGGEPVTLSATAGLAAYRIAQEALTNAIRHGAPAGGIRVRLDRRPDGLALVVESLLAGPLLPPEPGRGLVGMEQRARLAGGWLTAGPDADASCWLVTCFLPASR